VISFEPGIDCSWASDYLVGVNHAPAAVIEAAFKKLRRSTNADFFLDTYLLWWVLLFNPFIHKR